MMKHENSDIKNKVNEIFDNIEKEVIQKLLDDGFTMEQIEAMNNEHRSRSSEEIHHANNAIELLNKALGGKG